MLKEKEFLSKLLEKPLDKKEVERKKMAKHLLDYALIGNASEIDFDSFTLDDIEDVQGMTMEIMDEVDYNEQFSGNPIMEMWLISSMTDRLENARGKRVVEDDDLF